MLNILCKENSLITFLICSCHHPVTLSQNNSDDQMKENQDQSVKFGNIFISSAASPQSQFSPMNQPPFYGPRPKYGSGFAGFLEMLNLPYLSEGYGNLEMGLDSSGSSSDRIRFETTKMQSLNHLHQAEKLMKILDFTDSVGVQRYISKAFEKVEEWKPYPESRPRKPLKETVPLIVNKPLDSLPLIGREFNVELTHGKPVTKLDILNEWNPIPKWNLTPDGSKLALTSASRPDSSSKEEEKRADKKQKMIAELLSRDFETTSRIEKSTAPETTTKKVITSTTTRPVVKKEEGGTVSENFKDDDYFFKPPSFINPRIKMKIDENKVIDENKAIDEKEATEGNEFIEHDHEEHEYVFNSEYDYDPEYLVDDYETEKPKIITEQCGGILSEPFGRISSGKFPLPYENDQDCEWLIQAPEGTTVTINFLKFSLEKSKTCRHDYLAIYDGASKAFPMLGKKYCGTSAPPNLHSSGNQLLISFKSDSSVRHPGFQLFYSTRILTPLAVPLNL